MSLSLAQLRQFVALADAGSVGGAALPPGFPSRRRAKNLRALEAELGVALVRRDSWHQLTETGMPCCCGRAVHAARSRRGQAELADAVKQARRPRSCWAHRRCRSSTATGAARLLRRSFRWTSRIVGACRWRRCRACATESLDFALGPSLPHTSLTGDLVAVPLYPNEMAIVVRHGHPSRNPLAGGPVGLRWITAGLGTANLVVDDMFTAAGLPAAGPFAAVNSRADRDHGAIDQSATIPRSLLALGIADRLLRTDSRPREDGLVDDEPVHQRDSPLNTAAGRLVRLIRMRAEAPALRLLGCRPSRPQKPNGIRFDERSHIPRLHQTRRPGADFRLRQKPSPGHARLNVHEALMERHRPLRLDGMLVPAVASACAARVLVRGADGLLCGREWFDAVIHALDAQARIRSGTPAKAPASPPTR